MEQEAAMQWCTQSVGSHLLFSPGFWQNVSLIPLDLMEAGMMSVSFGMRRLADLWLFNRLEQRELGLLPTMAAEGSPAARCCAWWRGLEPRYWPAAAAAWVSRQHERAFRRAAAEPLRAPPVAVEDDCL